MKSHKQIIDLWQNRAEFARELGVDYQRARQWYTRDSIPPEFWCCVVNVAQERGFGEVTLDLLASIKSAERKRSECAA